MDLRRNKHELKGGSKWRRTPESPELLRSRDALPGSLLGTCNTSTNREWLNALLPAAGLDPPAAGSGTRILPLEGGDIPLAHRLQHPEKTISWLKNTNLVRKEKNTQQRSDSAHTYTQSTQSTLLELTARPVPNRAGRLFRCPGSYGSGQCWSEQIR